MKKIFALLTILALAFTGFVSTSAPASAGVAQKCYYTSAGREIGCIGVSGDRWSGSRYYGWKDGNISVTILNRDVYKARVTPQAMCGSTLADNGSARESRYVGVKYTFPSKSYSPPYSATCTESQAVIRYTVQYYFKSGAIRTYTVASAG